jgi:hypothetical protein
LVGDSEPLVDFPLVDFDGLDIGVGGGLGVGDTSLAISFLPPLLLTTEIYSTSLTMLPDLFLPLLFVIDELCWTVYYEFESKIKDS